MQPKNSALAVALVSIGFAVGALAQSATGSSTQSGSSKSQQSGTTGSSTGSTSSTSTKSGSSTTTSASAGKSGSSSGSAKLAHGERKFIEDAGKDGMAEVELGRIAASKASDPQVKQFAQRMVTDHGKANDELKQLASSKGVDVPAGVDKKHEKEADKLQKNDAAKFDKEYMEHMVKEHKKDVKEFEKQAKHAKDPDVKAFASRTLPTLQEHLAMAQQIEKSVKSSGHTGGAAHSGSTAGNTGGSATGTTAAGGSGSAMGGGNAASTGGAASSKSSMSSGSASSGSSGTSKSGSGK